MADMYYGVRGDYAWKLKWNRPNYLEWYNEPRLMRESEQVWYQGPRGGVRMIKNGKYANHIDHSAPYLRQESARMKQFVWVKLRAQELGLK